MAFCLKVSQEKHLEGDQPAEQPDRPDRQLLQDVGGLPPERARPLRQQDLLPRAPDTCGE